MRILNDQLLYSASDLANFLDCEHLTALDLQALLHPETAPSRTVLLMKSAICNAWCRRVARLLT
jgi:hypothetical protein